MKVGAEIKGYWDWEDHCWVSNSSEFKSMSLFACLLLIFTSSYLVSNKHVSFTDRKLLFFNYSLQNVYVVTAIPCCHINSSIYYY